MSDDIVLIEARFGEKPPIEEERVGWPRCEHAHTILDEIERRVRCRDCNASLDAYDVLVTMARQWHRWKSEADQLRVLRADYQRIEREKWERAVERHLAANPLHRAEFTIDPSGGWRSRPTQQCRICIRLEQTYRGHWGPIPLKVAEPPR